MKVNKYQIIGIALIIIIINFIIGNFSDFSKVFNYWFSIVRPIVIGIILAYFIYPLVMLIYNKTNNEALRFKHLNYYVSIFIAYFIIFIFFYLVYVLISPIIIDNFFKIGHLDVNNIINGLQSFFIDLQTNIRILNNVDLMGLSQDILKNVTNYFSTNNINNIVQSILGLTSSVYAYLMGFIVSIYLIVSKEELFKASNKFFEAILNERQFIITKKYFLLFEKTFKRFFFGKMLDSLIIGIIAFFGLWILKVPFYSLLALLIGITNMIPYFGPFIGGIPAVIVTLFITGNPINALVCGLFVLVLQQFDGLYLGPKILGKAVKISSVWVLIAIIIGGALFRVTGLLLCVPFAATFKEGFDEFYKYRMKKKAVFQKKEYLRNKQSESE